MGRRGALLLLALFVLVALGPSCRCSDPSSPIVQDFEGRAGLHKWPRDSPGVVETSTDWKADGERSMRVDPSLLGSIEHLLRTDLRGADALRLRVHNPSDRLTSVGFELSDDHDSLHDRHKRSFGAPPGDSTIDLDLSGELWRGEENRPYRGETKTPIDLGHISRIAFENRGERPIYIDSLEVVTEAFEVPPGAFALDFGGPGSRVMGKTAGVFPDTTYDPGRHFGFVSGKRSALESSMSYPSPLLGDGLAWQDSVFQVDLAGGPYVGWVAFERGGFWEDEATGYDEAALVANGAVVAKDTFSLAGPSFFFEDAEVTSMAEAQEKLVWPAHAVKRFSFEAKAGPNQFSLAVPHHSGPPLRVAGMFLAPDTPAGRAFVDGQEARQKRALAAVFPEEDRSRHGAAVEVPFGVEQRPSGEVSHPRDAPAAPLSASPAARVIAIAGHRAFVQLALYAREERRVSVKVEPAQAAGVAAPEVSVGIYGPKRSYEGGAAWIETEYFRPVAPAESFAMGPALSRSVLLAFDVPAAAPAGAAAFRLRFEAEGRELATAAVTLEVVRVELPAFPIPVGLFMNALPFGPGVLGEERWWQLQEALLAMEGEAGLNTPTGGEALSYSMTAAGDGYTFSGERALRYLEIAGRHGMDKAVVSYTGFVPSLKHERPDARRFQRSLADFESKNRLPPHYVYAYDEPSTSEELSAVVKYLGPFRAAGVKTIGFLATANGDDFGPVIDATFAPAVSTHSPAQLNGWVAAQRHVFLYNLGTDRLKMGPDLVQQIRIGISGRLEWIGVYTQGFAFNDLDGREPSYGMFVIHDRLGALPTPRWLSLREGLIDARIQLAVEKVAASGPPLWPASYPANAAQWPDSALEEAREASLRKLAQ